MKTIVEVEGVNGEWFTIAGPRAGEEGVWLGTGVDGLFDPPVKTVYETPGNYPGARYLNHRVLRRDIVFGVEILNDRGGNTWGSRESEWRKAWDYDGEATIYVTTEQSGRRWIKARLTEQPEVDMHTDPNGKTLNRTIMVVTCADPFWREDDVLYTAKTKTDTRFDPTFWTPPWPWEELPKEEMFFDVKPSDGNGGVNPTDQIIFPKWILPGAVDPPAEFGFPFPEGIDIPWERAPFTTFMLPDYSFAKDATEAESYRRLKLPGLIYGENTVVDTDPRMEQVTSETGSQVWARMNGVRFRNFVPPYTESRKFEFTASGCAQGQVVQLRLPRPWSRPWGLE